MGDRERWDAKYRGHLGLERSEPEPFVLEALDRVGPPGAGQGCALDLAAGTGRHALELARRGWRTSAWDVSPVALAVLGQRARDAGLAVDGRAVDLLAEGASVRGETFDLVVCVLFLDRGLLASLAELVAPGGHLVFETATVDWPREKPPARFRLERGELGRGVPGLDPVWSLESGGRAVLLARRAT